MVTRRRRVWNVSTVIHSHMAHKAMDRGFAAIHRTSYILDLVYDPGDSNAGGSKEIIIVSADVKLESASGIAPNARIASA